MSDTTQSPEPDPKPEPHEPRAEGAAEAGDDLAEAIRQRDEYFEQLQRTRAEFVNYQKRAKAQADSDRTYAASRLAEDLLNVLDNLERGLEAARSSGASTIIEGLELVYRQALEVLARHGVEPIVSLGEPFDPSYHEAIAQIPSAEYPEGTVARELGRGYRIRDRVLRPSRVAVSTGPARGQDT